MRCAIYTRKSTEEGLDQEFNSLDAQREAAEAFIQSQRREGWIALPEFYDDGGFTGANMDRPALTRLLHAVEAGELDCVVVYKVDRLSRSLLDFTRMLSVFEKHKVSFVAVTQQFNTSTSLGRLTLNILLSFIVRRDLIGVGNQPVAFISSFEVAPPGRFSRSRILAVLLPSRATLDLATSGLVRPLGAFLAGVALRADLALAGATLARRGATRAFLLAFGFLLLAVAAGVPFSSGINVVIFNFSLAVMFAVTTWITRVLLKCKSNLHCWSSFSHLLVGRKRAFMDLWLTATERNTLYGHSGVEGD